ncbi:MAG: sigma-70 family RNA polymerase sigma factor [Chthonomonas sp.]|nr:sigma-70 family RNA polymerase sigma factor [Chthonomonas sp.]
MATYNPDSYAYRYSHLADEEVVSLARTGLTDATECIVARYRNFVRLKALGFYVSGGDTEDVIQEGMIGLCRAIRDYRPDRLPRFRPFAELCVTRQIISAVKGATRSKRAGDARTVSLDAEYGEQQLAELVADERSVNPERLLLQKEFPKEIRQLMERKLSPMEICVLKRYLAGQSYIEMGEALHCPPKTVDNALQRVRKKIGPTLRN